MYRNTNYVVGSAAPKIEVDVYKKNPVLREIKAKKAKRKISLFNVSLVCAVTILMGFIIFRYNYIAELNYKVIEVNKQSQALANENTHIKVDIERKINLSKIRKEATTKLKMQKPAQYQKVYISIDKGDFTVANN